MRVGPVPARVYAFAFGQRDLMAGLGLQGSKITRIDRPTVSILQTQGQKSACTKVARTSAPISIANATCLAVVAKANPTPAPIISVFARL
jgi:hypothetical protein